MRQNWMLGYVITNVDAYRRKEKVSKAFSLVVTADKSFFVRGPAAAISRKLLNSRQQRK